MLIYGVYQLGMVVLVFVCCVCEIGNLWWKRTEGRKPIKLGLRSHHKSHNSVLIQNMDLCLDSVICLDPAYSCGISYTHEVLHMI